MDSMHEVDVTVVGLGFTGLPIAVAAAKAGLRVVGVDSSTARIGEIVAGIAGCGRTTVPDGEVAEVLSAGRLRIRPADDLPAAAAHVLCVPTPPAGDDGGLGADLNPLLRAVDAVAARLRRDDLVLVQSTCPPGTVERVLAPRLAAGGLTPGTDFALAYSPVRIMPGPGAPDPAGLPRVVAGLTDRCRDRAVRFLGRFSTELVPVRSVVVAELTKVFENTFRLVNVSLVNELAAVCRELDAEPDEVLDAAATKPFGFLGHRPGPGAGGSCVPVAADVFAATARRHGVTAEVVGAAAAVNRAMPARTLHAVERLLVANGLPPLAGGRVVVVGVTYRPDVAHTGLAPGVRVLEQLRPVADVGYHDPYVPRLVLGDGTTLRNRTAAPGVADVVLLLTRHAATDDAELRRWAAPVVDCTTGTPRLLTAAPHPAVAR